MRRAIGLTKAHARQDGTEALRTQKGLKLAIARRLGFQRGNFKRQRRIVIQRHQAAGNPRHFGVFQQRLAPLGLLDFARAGQQGFKITIFGDQLRRGLDANARHAWHIICRIAGQCLHIHHFFRRDAEFFHHFRRTQRLLLHGIEHLHRRADQLHQILVRRHNRDMPAGRFKRLGIGGDQIIRLKTFLFHTRDAKSIGGIADQAKLRHQFRRRIRPMRLIGSVNLIAKRIPPGIKHHRDMARGVAQQELG